MPRKTLAETLSGRDAAVLAQNVKERRTELGWSKLKLAQEAKISYQTILNIEQGRACSPFVEHKLAVALRTAEGRLWERRDIRREEIHQAATDRWYFSEQADCNRYWKHRLMADAK